MKGVNKESSGKKQIFLTSIALDGYIFEEIGMRWGQMVNNDKLKTTIGDLLDRQA